MKGHAESKHIKYGEEVALPVGFRFSLQKGAVVDQTIERVDSSPEKEKEDLLAVAMGSPLEAVVGAFAWVKKRAFGWIPWKYKHVRCGYFDGKYDCRIE